MDTKIGIIIVTYNRLDCLKKCLGALYNLEKLYSKIYIINNNSTDGTEEYLSNINQSEVKINCCTLNENLGGSYGFWYGMKIAIEDGMDFIWGMDDDAYPQKGSLHAILEACNSFDMNNTALWSNSHSHFNNSSLDKIQLINSWTFVGFFISSTLIRRIGLPRNDLFIFFDDKEYANRIIKSGASIYKINDSIIIHEGALNITNNDQYVTRKFMGKNYSLQLLPSWKWYYLIRNKILISENLNDKVKAIRFGLIMIIKSFIIRYGKTKIMIQALIHGIIGVSGKKVDPSIG